MTERNRKNIFVQEVPDPKEFTVKPLQKTQEFIDKPQSIYSLTGFKPFKYTNTTKFSSYFMDSEEIHFY